MTLVLDPDSDASKAQQSSPLKTIKYKDENENAYEGIMTVNPRSGQGKIRYENGDVYEGSWVDDQKSGQGKIIYEEGDVYEGLWKDDKKSGQGRQIYKNKEIFEGIWADGWRSNGKMTYKNGDVYVGSFLKGKRSGKGKMNHSDGRMTEGDWEDDRHHGHIKVIFPTGAIFEGLCENGQAYGHGKKNYENEDVYEGNWESDKRSGMGKMVCKNGDIHNGTWFKDVFKKGYIYYGNKTKITYFEEGIQTNLLLITVGENVYLQYRGFITIEIKLSIVVNTFEELFKLRDEQITIETNLSEEDRDMIECPISLSVMNVPIITSCKHSFCRLAFDHYRKNDLCPKCCQVVTHSVADDNIIEMLKKIKFSMPVRNLTFGYDVFKNISDIKSILVKFKSYVG